ncbi:class I SAM-dependent methyltransferase [Candidatus Woesearchaeota archaeon]|nr:class I SAM-dependent methyltransferase [Candidatus Woesearchaeota archaeon]
MKHNNKCIICDSLSFKGLFSKESAHGEQFTLLKCRTCGMEFLASVPDEEEIKKYYEREYFTKRTEWGYDNYFSPALKAEIERVFKLNLEDLDFYNFEKNLGREKRCLDIGCAAGYFVGYMKDRGWDSAGIEISGDCVDFAQKNGLNVIQGDYLKTGFNRKFDLITLWATIEHLHRPGEVIEKAYNDLADNGMILLSTCRTGGLNFMKLKGKRWRFYNFPEHIFFFSIKTLKTLLEQRGFSVINYRTYGSDFGKSGTISRKVADYIAKRYNMGDMMIVSAKKVKD